MLRPFHASDLTGFVPQPLQPLDKASTATLLEHAARGPVWTACNRDGRVIAVGGFSYVHPEWATAWTVLGAQIGLAMPALTRAVLRTLRSQTARRIDMHVVPEDFNSTRWAAMLGFRLEAMISAARPDGGAMGVWRYEGVTHG